MIGSASSAEGQTDWKDTTRSSAIRTETTPRHTQTAVAFGFATNTTKAMPGYTGTEIWQMRYDR